MSKYILVTLIIVLISFGCTTQTTVNETEADELGITSFSTTKTELGEGQTFNVLLTVFNGGVADANNVRALLIGNIADEDIVSYLDSVPNMRAGESRSLFWTIEAPTIGIPGAVDYFLQTRVYYSYDTEAFSDAVFIPNNFAGTTESPLLGSSEAPIKISIDTESPVTTYQEVTEFDVSIKIANVGDGRVGYLAEDGKNENTSMKNIIKDIEIRYPKTWDLVDSENWVDVCNPLTLSGEIKSEDLSEDDKISFQDISTECSSDTDCESTCTDGVYNAGVCNDGFCELGPDSDCASTCTDGVYNAGVCTGDICGLGPDEICESGECSGDVCFICIQDSDCPSVCTDGIYEPGFCNEGICDVKQGEICESGECSGDVCLIQCIQNSDCESTCTDGVYNAGVCNDALCELGPDEICENEKCSGDVCFICIQDSDCPSVCTDGIYEPGFCNNGICDLWQEEICESGQCSEFGCLKFKETPGICSNQNIIRSDYDGAGEIHQYQRHRLIRDTGTEFVISFNKDIVSTQEIESIKVFINYSYVVESDDTLVFTVKGK